MFNRFACGMRKMFQHRLKVTSVVGDKAKTWRILLKKFLPSSRFRSTPTNSASWVSIEVGPTFYFRGIVSSGLVDQITCDVSKFSIFTDVLKFKPWIDKIVGQDGETLIRKVVPANLICTIYKYKWKHCLKDNTKRFANLHH